ncbi:c-type cytochrome [Pseudomonadota bacterium AL_CKDN230030165-1A_HGKHYDSX7]
MLARPRSGGPPAACNALPSTRFSVLPALLLALAGCGDPAAPLAPKPSADALPGADATRGRARVAELGCAACHSVPGLRAPTAQVGPPLEGLARRAYIGGKLPNTPDNLVRWLIDPPAIDPRTAMPSHGLDRRDAADIAAYLLAQD